MSDSSQNQSTPVQSTSYELLIERADIHTLTYVW